MRTLRLPAGKAQLAILAALDRLAPDFPGEAA